jgi:hypothetical protein
VLTALAAETRVVSEHLGDDHDLSVLATVLSGDGPDLLGPDRTTVLRVIEDRRDGLVEDIRSGAQRLYADKPGAFVRRLRTWWSDRP